MNSSLVVFSDLDGSLLDHDDYNYEAAKPVIARLKSLDYPLVLTTSKTRAEVEVLHQEMALNTPFIIENGAAVIVPATFLSSPAGSKQTLWVKGFAESRTHWLQLLDEIPAEFKRCFRGFSQMSTEEICTETGLAPAQARLANQREFSEPVKWLGSETEKQAFIDYLSQQGAQVLQGGRFLHVSGESNKGQAMKWLVSEMNRYEPHQTLISVAIGDSANDNDMLEMADIAVQIRSAYHPFELLNRTHQLYRSTHTGPEGWAECLNQILKHFSESKHG